MQSQHYKEAKTPASRGKQLSHIEIKEGEEGGHIVTHHYSEDGMAYHKPKEYSFGKDEDSELDHHLKKHLHIQAEAKHAAPDTESDEE